MELIKGNLLLMITLFGAFIFVALWGKVYEGPIRWRFTFFRKKNMYYEWKRIGTLLLGVSLGCVGLYKILSYCMQFQGVPMYYLCLPFLLLLCYYFILSIGIRSFLKMGVFLVIAMIFLMPTLFIGTMLIRQKCLDIYCDRLVVLLTVLDIFFGIKNILHWKKGDIML